MAKERELISATAVCQYWRMALLSFPRLWCNVGGSPAEIGAYLSRLLANVYHGNLGPYLDFVSCKTLPFVHLRSGLHLTLSGITG